MSIKGNSLSTNKNILSEIITSDGGVVFREDIKLVFPPGAVDDSVPVNVTSEDPSKYYGLIVQKDLENDVMFGAPIINLHPKGRVFKKPITLVTKLKIENFQKENMVILHGIEAGDENITWCDITHKSKVDETNAEVTIEIRHFSLIVTLLKLTWIRSKELVSRLNLCAFNYTLSVLLNKNPVHEQLALLFVSQDVFNQQFYKEDQTSSLVELKAEGFKELHVRSIDEQEEKRIYNSESLKVSVRLGEDYNLADNHRGVIEFSVHSHDWWNAGKVIKLPLKWTKDVRILCGTISVQGVYGHTSEIRFSDESEF